MSFVCEIAVPGEGAGDRVAEGWIATHATVLAALPGCGWAAAYTPAEGGADPLTPPEPAPAAVLMLGFPTREGLAEALVEPTTEAALAAAPGQDVTANVFRRESHPLPGATVPPESVAYLVRYFQPADDPAAFVAEYTAHHPEVQARLHGIRAIHCDVPLPDLRARATPPAPYLIGNEVGFADAEAFAAAMRSPARAELRAHMADFPPWSGRNSHVLMQRRALR
jgi:hypothetical protein